LTIASEGAMPSPFLTLSLWQAIWAKLLQNTGILSFDAIISQK
jgi:hypothetical protein